MKDRIILAAVCGGIMVVTDLTVRAIYSASTSKSRNERNARIEKLEALMKTSKGE